MFGKEERKTFQFLTVMKCNGSQFATTLSYSQQDDVVQERTCLKSKWLEIVTVVSNKIHILLFISETIKIQSQSHSQVLVMKYKVDCLEEKEWKTFECESHDNVKTGLPYIFVHFLSTLMQFDNQLWNISQKGQQLSIQQTQTKEFNTKKNQSHLWKSKISMKIVNWIWRGFVKWSFLPLARWTSLFVA